MAEGGNGFARLNNLAADGADRVAGIARRLARGGLLAAQLRLVAGRGNDGTDFEHLTADGADLIARIAGLRARRLRGVAQDDLVLVRLVLRADLLNRAGVGRIDAIKGRRSAVFPIPVLTEADQIVVLRIRPVLGGVPPHLAVDDGGRAVGKARVRRIDRAVRGTVRLEENIAHALPRAPQQQAAVPAHLHKLRGEDRQIRIIRQPAHLYGGVGEAVLRHGGDEHVPLAVVRIDARRRLIDAAAGNEIVRARDGEAAEIRAGGIIILDVPERHQTDALAAQGVARRAEIGQAFSAAADRLVAIEIRGAGTSVAVVERDEPIAVEREELVEGMADIAVFVVHHVAAHVGDGHVTLAHEEGQVRLMTGIHLVAGVDIEIRAVLRHAQGARVERNGRILAIEADAVEALPGF